MVALDARFRLEGTKGDRWIPAADFFLGLFTTSLEPGELLVEIEVPPSLARSGHGFIEVSRRHGDYALTGACAAVALDEQGACAGARLVLFGVGEGPWVATRANQLLAGARPGAEAIAAAAETVRADVDPPSDIHASSAYRRHLSGVLARRVLERAFGRARAGVT
jgi:CO/xanthine dehydrogenase FAD-binding subunit